MKNQYFLYLTGLATAAFLPASSQNIGVGTSTASINLDIETATGTFGGFDLNETSTGKPIVRFQLAGVTKFDMGVDNPGTDNFQIDNTGFGTTPDFSVDAVDGYVGFGVENAIRRLHIQGGGAAETVLIEQTNNANDPCIGFALAGTRKYTMGVDGSATGTPLIIGTTDLATSKSLTLVSGVMCVGSTAAGEGKIQVSNATGGKVRFLRDDNSCVSGDILGVICFDATDGNLPTIWENASTAIKAVAAEDQGALNKGGRLEFYVSPNGKDNNVASTEAMEIDETGNVGMGVSAASHLLQVNGQGRSTATTWATSSDIRVKENITPLENSLSAIMSLRPVTYRWKNSYLKHNTGMQKQQTGFIAQEVKLVVPQMVTYTKETFGKTTLEDFHVLNQDALYPLLVGSIKEQQAQYRNHSGFLEEEYQGMNALYRQQASLETKLEKLEKKIE
jgi:hypothetical protein